MTNKQLLLVLLSLDPNTHTVEVKEISTGKTGVANISDIETETVEVFYGDSSGKDDCAISLDDFIKRFEITKVIYE